MKRIKGGSLQGLVTARVKDGKLDLKFKETGQVVSFAVKNLPKYVQGLKQGSYYASLTSDEEFLGIRPKDAIVKLKFQRFFAKEGEVPAPVTKTGKYGDFRTFTVLFTITGPDEYKGMVVPASYFYLFVDDGDGGVAIKGGGKSADQLESLLEVTGVEDDPIKPSDNILPSLQKFMLKRAAEFQGIMQDGFIQSLSELEDESDEDFETDEDGFESDDEDDDEFDTKEELDEEEIPF